MMKLEDKGPIVPAPVLKGRAQKVSLEIQSWPEMVSATHWTIGDSTKVNGADFYFKHEELGHIHLDGEMHLLLNKRLAQLLIEKKLAEKFPWGRDWVQLSIESEETAALAAWLFRLGFDRLNGTATEDLELRIIELAKRG